MNELKTKISYACPVCEAWYPSEEDARNCESAHAPVFAKEITYRRTEQWEYTAYFHKFSNSGSGEMNALLNLLKTIIAALCGRDRTEAQEAIAALALIFNREMP